MPEKCSPGPAASEKRLSLTPSGNIRYQLRTPCNDGTTHVIFDPLDFIGKLAALVPGPRVNLARFDGVFAPDSKYRVDVTPAKRGEGRARQDNEDKTPRTAPSRHDLHPQGIKAQCLKRVFNIDLSTCEKCGGDAKVIACIEDPAVIDKILVHLIKKGALPPAPQLLSAARVPPGSIWLA